MNTIETLVLLQRIDSGYDPSELELKELSKIEEIIWKDINKIPNSINLLTHLRKLCVYADDMSSFSRHVIHELPETIGCLNNLESLDIHGSSISELPETVWNLVSLQYLNLSFTQIHQLSELIKNLTSLQSLDLSGAKISELPETIGHLTNLKYLNCSGASISKLPGTIGELTNLQYLDLSVTNISYLPDTIGNIIGLQSLNLSNLQIDKIPETIGKLVNLKNLYLNNIQIEELPEAIGSLKSLQNLILSNAQINELPETVGNLTSLEKLELSRTHIDEIPNKITGLINLQSLDLSKTQIRELPDKIGNLSSLQYLNLSNGQIRTLPKTITDLQNLRFLDLSKTQIREIPEKIGNLTNLENLDISITIINKIPEEIGNLKKLQSLNLSNTLISKLPETIGNLNNLRSLDISNTQLNELPKSIGGLIGVQYINISDTKIKGSLPEAIGELQNLQSLNIRRTDITGLPDSIGNLIRLKNLDLCRTKLSVLPESMRLLTNLESLDLCGTQITVIPSRTLENLKKLQSLDLSVTKICELPKEIGSLVNLQGFDLSETRIRKLPKSIKNLTNLKGLGLSNTQLSELPEEIGELKSLKILDLSNSALSELPEVIGELPVLRKLILNNLTLSELPMSLLKLNLNYKDEVYSRSIREYSYGIFIGGLRLTKQPIEVFSRSREYIIEYYKANEDTIPINTCKVALLGDGGAGKSLIVNRLMHDGEKPSEYDGSSTPGIYISPRKYQMGNDEIELHFWDFGGQDIMRTMHRLFLTKRTLYIIVANGRDNKADSQAWYWIRNIKSFANGAPVVLIVTHKDQNPYANVNHNGLIREYPELKDVRIISALNDTKEQFNKEVRDVICKVISNMDSVHTPFPKPFLLLMNELKNMDEDYITSDDFITKCKKNGVDTKRELLDETINWYQDLGVCFYSKKHPTSGQYMVLKPRWILNALYILIFNGRNYAENGIISENSIYELIQMPVGEENIKKVWNDISYNLNDIQYILNVLQNFELIYKLDSERFFIPMLCDENEPELISEYISEDVFHIRFEYDYLPDNVIHRLMVRHGYELNTTNVWKRGALFEQKSCKWSAVGCIRDNCLEIYAKAGDQQSNPVNSYLNIFRDSINMINDNLGLKAKEYIAYRKEGKEDVFKYNYLLGNLKTGQSTVYSEVFNRQITINEILGIVRDSDGRQTKEVIKLICAVLTNMSERCAEMIHREETELTADFQDAISLVLATNYNIWVAREYTMGRALKKLGEADLYFYTCKGEEKNELYILENKVIASFEAGYKQLMGYLNPNFTAGFTLSINKTKKWEEAFDYICERLEELQIKKGAFAPILIDRVDSVKRTMYIKTEHIVPETGRTMPVYHFVLQLYDEPRQLIAKDARKKRS